MDQVKPHLLASLVPFVSDMNENTNACLLEYGDQHHSHSHHHQNGHSICNQFSPSKSGHYHVHSKCSKEYQLCYNAMKALFHHNPESWKVLWDLSSPDPSQREEGFRNCRRLLMSWFHGFGSPKDLDVLQNPEELREFSNWGDTSMFYLIHEQTPDLLRLQCTAPLQDVRLWCGQMLAELKALEIPIPRPVFDSPSSFIPWSEMNHLHTYFLPEDNSSVSVLYREHFYKHHRVENYLMVMGFHPEYLESYLKCRDYLLEGAGPLPYAERHYICIMAAARHRCSYLMRLHAQEYLLHGGDQAWLDRPSTAPLRLQNLKEINCLLAHQPWLITPEHIRNITPSSSNTVTSRGSSYCLSEMMHAVTLLCHSHALCSFLFASGTNPEIDCSMGHTSSLTSVDTTAAQQRFWHLQHSGCSHSEDDEEEEDDMGSVISETESEVPENGHENGHALQEPAEAAAHILDDVSHVDTEDEATIKQQETLALLSALKEVAILESEVISEEVRLQRFQSLLQENRAVFNSLFTCAKEEEEASAATTSSPHPTMSILNDSTHLMSSSPAFLDPFVRKFLTEPVTVAQCSPECLVKSHSETTTPVSGVGPDVFRVLDFSWDDDAVTVMNDCLPDLGFYFNERFMNIYDLTYCSLGNVVNVRTDVYRSAVWKYVHSLYLVLHDDYTYVGVERLLPYPMRCYLQRVAMAPHTMRHAHFRDSALAPFTTSEKIHLILMVMEARLQASLLYALRAIKRSIASL